jgi:hypothetical protein
MGEMKTQSPAIALSKILALISLIALSVTIWS